MTNANPRRDPGVLAALIVLGQALTLVVLGGWAAVGGLTGHADDRVAAELMAALAVLTAAGLAVAGRGAFFGRRWARSPILVWELLMLPVGFSLAHAIPAAGGVLLVSAAAALWGVFAGRGAESGVDPIGNAVTVIR